MILGSSHSAADPRRKAWRDACSPHEGYDSARPHAPRPAAERSLEATRTIPPVRLRRGPACRGDVSSGAAISATSSLQEAPHVGRPDAPVGLSHTPRLRTPRASTPLPALHLRAGPPSRSRRSRPSPPYRRTWRQSLAPPAHLPAHSHLHP